APSLATLRHGLGRVDEPLARALCWGACWDMTRDSELAAREFVGLVTAHAVGESDLAVLQGLTARALQAANRFVVPAARRDVLATLAAAAARALAEATAGSDAQLAWARTRAAAAVDEADLRWAEALLDGRGSEPGLAVDTELRWHLLVTLAAAGRVDDAAIAAEAERDPTDMGARRAATARAARPTAEAKAKAWATLVDDAEATLALRRAVAAGLWQPGQDALLAPYVERFGGALSRVWAERNAEEAISLTAGLYPQTIIDRRVVTAADAVLEAGALPAPGLRVVAEQRDHTLRALAARDADATGGTRG
ncbi:MAG: ERAP1-like C-terminal domain-containing protein, partial [Actinomycetota bacterium]